MQDRKPLTKQQKEVLDFVLRSVTQNGYPPSLQEIANHLESHVGTAQYYIDTLTKKGYIKRKANVTRGIIPLSKNTIPLLGIIAAGNPIEPTENPEEITIPPYIEIDPRYPHYALRVSGDSMKDMNIADGDIVLIRHQLTAEDHEPVVAITEKGATLKVLRKVGGKKWLEPRNKDYKPIYPEELEVRGKFVGLIRSEN